MQPNLIDIPPLFYPFDSKEPFNECKVCGLDLTLGTTDYFIEKAFKNHLEYNVQDVVFEYAICSKCALTLQQSISEESKQHMAAFFQNHPNFLQKMEAFQNGNNTDLQQVLTKCSLTGKPIAELEEYMIYGHFRGNKMITTTMPNVVSGKVIDELSGLLSNATLGAMNDFKDQYFGGPVALEDLWKDKPIFL